MLVRCFLLVFLLERLYLLSLGGCWIVYSYKYFKVMRVYGRCFVLGIGIWVKRVYSLGWR